jgi:hypothetical protein
MIELGLQNIDNNQCRLAQSLTGKQVTLNHYLACLETDWPNLLEQNTKTFLALQNGKLFQSNLCSIITTL